MRFLFLLAFYNFYVYVYSWKITNWISFNHKSNDEEQQKFSDTGRIFVTLFGYPHKCEKSGIIHACTLSLACWWVGGSSQEGCGANPWIVACCVKSAYQKENLQPIYEINNEENYQNMENTISSIDDFQKRNDDDEDEEDRCGLSPNRILMKRIIGGNEAKFAQFPWQAHIKILTYQCGGVLVSHRFVATAAHCIIKATIKDIVVYLGELDTQNTGQVLEYAPSERHTVKNIIIHPKFEFKTTQPDRYDLALLQLTTKTREAYHILPICLPNGNLKLEGQKAVVAGWGKIKPSTDLTGTNVLRSTIVPILDTKECMSWHRIKDITVDLHEEMLCAGHKDGRRDACLGDSGGPLIVSIRSRWTLVGIISAGFGCGEPNQPGIYHSIAVTANWIRSIIYS